MSAPTTKPPSEWTEADIQTLIVNGVKESTELDYKESRALQKTENKKQEISKAVSAFANAAGGALVYGVSEDGHIPMAIDGGSDPSEITKEWLEDVITSNIRPRITGIIINQIELSGEKSGRVVYVVSVPQSFVGAPHQAADKKYYRRFNFKSEPMEDHEIRDVMRRSIGPDLHCDVRVGDSEHAEELELRRNLGLMVTLANDSLEPALYALVDIYLDARLKPYSHFDVELVRKGVRCRVNGDQVLFDHLRANWVTPHWPPIWRGVEHEVGNRPIEISREEGEFEFYCAVLLNAPHMTKRTVLYRLRPTEVTANQRAVMMENAKFEILGRGDEERAVIVARFP